MLAAIAGILLAQPGALILPEPCPGWTAAEQRTVTPANVFDYMNGAGELYLAYGFEEITVREYTRADEARITCEAYRMPAPPDAFGLFSLDRTGEPMKIGQGAVYADGLLIAWHGRYFLRILADRDNADVRTCVVSLAKQIVPLCGESGAPPEALKWLPGKGLDPKSVHFFHTHNCLNHLYFLATANILNLSRKTDAVLGSYRSKPGKSTALVAGYPAEPDAKAAWASFLAAYADDAKLMSGFSACRLENGKWLAGKRIGRRIAVVLESPSREEALALAALLARQQALPTPTTKETK